MTQQNQNTLAAYRNAKSKTIIAATLLIPFGAVAFFILFSNMTGGAYALDAPLEITSLIRTALVIHGLYFIVLPFSFELTLNQLPLPGIPKELKFGAIPEKPDNLYWMMSNLSAELFFVGAVALLLMASQSVIPRWALIIPMAQAAYNMKNDLIWIGFGKQLSPIGKPITIMLMDTVLIGGCFAVYIYSFLR